MIEIDWEAYRRLLDSTGPTEWLAVGDLFESWRAGHSDLGSENWSRPELDQFYDLFKAGWIACRMFGEGSVRK